MFMSSKPNLDSPELASTSDEDYRNVKKASNYIIAEDSKNQETIPSNYFEVFSAEDDLTSLVITRDGKNLFISKQDGSVFLYNYANGELKRRLILKGNLPVLGLSLSPNESFLAIAQFSSASVYDLIAGEIVAKQTKIKGRVKTIEWDPNGEMLSFGLVSGGIYVWRVFTSEDLENYDAESVTPIVGIAFLPSAEAMFTASRQGEVKLWRLIKADEKLGFYDPNAVMDKDKKGSYVKDVAALNSQIETIWLSSNNLYAASSDGLVYFWKVRGLKFLGSFRADLRGVLSAGPINKTNLIITSGREQNLKIWCPNEIQASNTSFGDTLKLINDEGLETSALSHAENLTPVYRSGIFNGTLNLIKISAKQPVLWAYEKTGNLLRFDLSKLTYRCNESS